MDENTNILTDAGIDCNTGINRLGGNKDFFYRLLNKFVADGSYSGLVQSYEDKDFEKVLNYAHALKGLASNLAVDSVTEPSTQINDKVKNGDYDIENHIEELKINYAKVINAINSLEV